MIMWEGGDEMCLDTGAGRTDWLRVRRRRAARHRATGSSSLLERFPDLRPGALYVVPFELIQYFAELAEEARNTNGSKPLDKRLAVFRR